MLVYILEIENLQIFGKDCKSININKISMVTTTTIATSTRKLTTVEVTIPSTTTTTTTTREPVTESTTKITTENQWNLFEVVHILSNIGPDPLETTKKTTSATQATTTEIPEKGKNTF